MGTLGPRVDASCWLHLLPLLAAMPSLLATGGPLSEDGPKCVCDFNSTVSCLWDSSGSARHSHITAETSCQLHTYKELKRHPRNKTPNTIWSSCDLSPRDPAHPALRACSLVSRIHEVFHHMDRWNISVVCESVNIPLSIIYRPADHVKLRPPRRPEVNLTTILMYSEDPRLKRVDERHIQLQWKQEDQPWEDGTLVNQTDLCQPLCQVELTGLGWGRRYQARSRVRPQQSVYQSVWSDWSPVLTWESAVCSEDPSAPDCGVQWEALLSTAVGAVVVLSLVILGCKMDRDTWVYVVKKIKGPPPPQLDKFLCLDGKSQVWLKTGLTIESHNILTGLDVISSVDVAHSYSNRTYSHILPQLGALSSLAPPPQGSLEPCSADSPYGPVGGGCGAEDARGGEPEENQGNNGEEGAPWGLDLLRMVSGAHMTVCQDYEKVGNVGARGSSRLRSPDSGVGCGEEEEERGGWGGCREGGEGGGSPREDGSQGSGGGSWIEKLLGEGVPQGAILGQGSLEVCLDYEKVRSLEVCLDYEKVQLLERQQGGAQSPDSGVGSGEGEEVSQDSLEDVDFCLGNKTFIFPPLSDTELSLRSSFVHGSAFCPGQGTSLPFSFTSGDGASMTSSSTLLPSSGGYMPPKTQLN